MDVEFIGVSPNINKIKQLIRKIADTEVNTLIFGETGVGKELVVQNLYKQSNRTGKPTQNIGDRSGSGVPDGVSPPSTVWPVGRR